MSPFLVFSHLLLQSHSGPLGIHLWRRKSSSSRPRQTRGCSLLLCPPFTSFLRPHSQDRDQLHHPTLSWPLPGALWPPETPPTPSICSRELCRSSGSLFSPPPALLLSSLSGRSVIEGVDVHPTPAGGWERGAGGGVLLREPKLPSAAALICRQLQTSVGPRSAPPINNGICALTQTDFPQTVKRRGDGE